MQVRPWLPVDNDEESDSAAAHADEAPSQDRGCAHAL